MTTTRRVLAAAALAASSLLVATGPSGPASAATADLLISEYVEGSSNNKAIEIYNGTGAAVDMSAYSLQMYFNGSTSPGLEIPLVGSVADGDVYIVANSSAAAAILAQADLTNGAGWFNGDDAVVLRKSGTPVDSLGVVGVDPGTQWGSDLTSTADNTLRRKSSICAGDPVTDDAFDPATEWDGFAQDTFDGLGAHVADCGDDEPTPVINEFSASTTGTDVEYVEIKAAAGTDLSGYTVLEIEGDSEAATGTVDEVIGLGVADASGYFLVNLPANSLENGTITLLLVQGFTGAAGDDLDTDDDGVLDVTPWSSVVDDIAVSDGGESDHTYAATVLGPDFDGLSRFAPGGASRIPDGTDTGAVADWARNDFDLYGITGFAGSPAIGEAVNTPGAENELITVLPPRPLKIHAIQGSGDVSPELGNGAIIEGVVTNAPDTDPDGVAETFGGFYVQEEDADADGDPATSEGIFVFSSGNVPVEIGDVVRVTGFVDEFNGLTEITDVSSIEVIAEDAPLPTAVEIWFPLDVDLERYEGMLVTMPQPLVVSEYFNYDRFGEVVVALPAPGHDRPMNPTAVYDPDSPEAAALAELNERSRITIDDGLTSQNPSQPVHPINRELFSLTNAFRGGDTVTGLTGTLHYGFGSYRMMPLPNEAGFETHERTPRPTEPDDVGGDIQVAALNALNYFLTLDDGTESGCGPDRSMECRGADANQPDELSRQRVKLINTLVGLDADVIGLNEIENTPGVEPLADLVAGLNDVLGAGTYDYIPAGTNAVVGTDAIKVGLIYRTDAVSPLGDSAVLDTPEFLDPLDSGTSKNRAAVAQTFVEDASGEVFSVVVNHLKSKGSACPGDFHPLAGNCNLTRTLAAQELAAWIDTDPTGTVDEDWLIVGDLNSYDKEDPIDALRDVGYTDLIGQYEGELAYSYVFDGEFGYLDYVMSSPSMTAQVTGATEWHINADEPDIFDYDTSFKSDYQDSLFDPTTPFRSSDHDAALVGLSLDAGFDATVTADPARLWPPNHELRAIDLVPATAGAAVDVLSASSSEADSGLGDDDVPNDIVIDGDDVQVRAERYALEGRTYTIEVAVAFGGQVVIGDATVVVPHDQRGRRAISRTAR